MVMPSSGIACRAGCSRTAPKILPTPEPMAGRRIQRRLPVEAGSRLSRSGRLLCKRHRTATCAGLRLNHAQPAPTGSPLRILDPGSLRELIGFPARKRTACAGGYSTLQRHAPLPLSNRQPKGLEIAVTQTKQTPDSFLIDNENTPSELHSPRHRGQYMITATPATHSAPPTKSKVSGRT